MRQSGKSEVDKLSKWLKDYARGKHYKATEQKAEEMRLLLKKAEEKEAKNEG